MYKLKEFYLYILLLLILVISLLGIVYGIFAGVWQFNPTDISWFNTKLVLTSIIAFIITAVIAKALTE